MNLTITPEQAATIQAALRNACANCFSLHGYTQCPKSGGACNVAESMAILDSAQREVEAKCLYCDGKGWTTEHHPSCDGNCSDGLCPIQEPCLHCMGTGTLDMEAIKAAAREEGRREAAEILCAMCIKTCNSHHCKVKTAIMGESEEGK